MFEKPQAEHRWFEDLLGDWVAEGECVMGPDQPPLKTTGRATIRTVGGLWFITETEGVGPDGNPYQTVATLGFDVKRGKYVGTFIGSMGSYQWVYEGALEETGKQLVLDCDGPGFDGASMAHYQDIVEKVGPDHWVLRSRVQLEDGSWNSFMQSHHHRVK
jgi:hypothetical protein